MPQRHAAARDREREWAFWWDKYSSGRTNIEFFFFFFLVKSLRGMDAPPSGLFWCTGAFALTWAVCVCEVVGLCLHYASLQFCFNGRKVAIRQRPTLGIDLCLMKYERMFLATTSSALWQVLHIHLFFSSSPCKYFFVLSEQDICLCHSRNK